MSGDAACSKCGEVNKAGSVRCARCGESLDVEEGVATDPELAAFDAAQAQEEEKNRKEYHDRILKDVAATGWGLITPQ